MIFISELSQRENLESGKNRRDKVCKKCEENNKDEDKEHKEDNAPVTKRY